MIYHIGKFLQSRNVISECRVVFRLFAHLEKALPLGVRYLDYCFNGFCAYLALWLVDDPQESFSVRVIVYELKIRNDIADLFSVGKSCATKHSVWNTAFCQRTFDRV